MCEMEVVPDFPKAELESAKTIKLPLAELALTGGALASMSESLRTVTTTLNIPADGIFKLNMRGYTGEVAQLASGDWLTGVVQKGKGIVGNASYTPVQGMEAVSKTVVPINPITLTMAVAIASINRRLDEIQKTQTEILEFLEEDKRAKIRGAMRELADTMNELKFNVGKEAFLQSRHNRVVSIRGMAEHQIELYKEKIKGAGAKKGLVLGDAQVADKVGEVSRMLTDYQAALFVFGFATYLDVLLSHNFECDYMAAVSRKMETRSLEYRQTYTDVFNMLEEQSRGSVEGILLGGLADAGKTIGGFISGIPFIGDGFVDEAFVGAGKALDSVNADRSRRSVERLLPKKDGCILPFIENLRIIGELHNSRANFYLDGDNVYCMLSDGCDQLD